MWRVVHRGKAYLFLNLLLLALTSPQAFAEPTPAPQVTQAAIGQLIQYMGTIKAIGADHKERLLILDSPIYVNDTIYTSADSYAGFRCTDGTLGVLHPDSVIKIMSYHYTYTKNRHALPDPEDHFNLSLVKGALDLNTGRIARANPDAFQLETALGKVRLTQPRATLAYQTQSGLAFKGSGIIENLQGEQQLVKAGFATLAPDSPINLVVSAPPLLLGPSITEAENALTEEIDDYGAASAYQEETAIKEVTQKEENAAPPASPKKVSEFSNNDYTEHPQVGVPADPEEIDEPHDSDEADESVATEPEDQAAVDTDHQEEAETSDDASADDEPDETSNQETDAHDDTH